MQCGSLHIFPICACTCLATAVDIIALYPLSWFQITFWNVKQFPFQSIIIVNIGSKEYMQEAIQRNF